MARFVLLLFYLVWLAAVPGAPRAGPVDRTHLVGFLAGFLVLVLIPAAWGRLLTRRANPWSGGAMTRYYVGINLARVALLGWLATGLFASDAWEHFLGNLLQPLGTLPLALPGMILGPLPAVLAWMGLWWAQYPVDRSNREQSVLVMLESDLPVHTPPTFAKIFATNFRMQVLFTTLPLILIAAIRDVAAVVLHVSGVANPNHSGWSSGMSFAAAIVVLLLAPALLKRILRTRPLPDSPLRRRLQQMCLDAGMRYRDVLLWQTDNTMCNAAVMGLLPRLRYVLLSDLLLETMTDEQIEAVFAHERGHIVHRHMIWYVVIVVLLILLVGLTGGLVQTGLSGAPVSATTQHGIDAAIEIASAGLFILVFGYFSRRFERQADVYAARTIESAGIEVPAQGRQRSQAAQSSAPAVGPTGAAVFASALDGC